MGNENFPSIKKPSNTIKLNKRRRKFGTIDVKQFYLLFIYYYFYVFAHDWLHMTAAKSKSEWLFKTFALFIHFLNKYTYFFFFSNTFFRGNQKQHKNWRRRLKNLLRHCSPIFRKLATQSEVWLKNRLYDGFTLCY